MLIIFFQSNVGKFWSLDQQARLFPAQISDDSPWKQEAISSRLDQETEDKTQEAIDLYFSQHHKITSPEDAVPSGSFAASQRSILMESVGNSPNFASENSRNDNSNNRQNRMDIGNEDKGNNTSSGANSLINESNNCQSIQTWLSFPPFLPPEVESMLFKYGIVDQQPNDGIKTIEPSSRPWSSSRPIIVREESNISNSTLRRKLFAGMIPDDEDLETDDEETGESNIKIVPHIKENCESTAMVISPGKVIMTPTAQRIPSPNKSVSSTY